METRIRQYNMRYDDNRPFLRRVVEFPHILRRLRHMILTPRFLIAFFRSIFFLRFFMIGLFYLLLPFDIMPERLLGFVGLIDDLLIGSIFIGFAMAGFALTTLRRRQ